MQVVNIIKKKEKSYNNLVSVAPTFMRTRGGERRKGEKEGRGGVGGEEKERRRGGEEERGGGE